MISVAGVVAGAIVLVSVPMRAQDETALKQAFEGKRVILKIDMPATSKGVDVWPERDLPVEFSDVANRLKSNGIAIRTGEEQMITKVHLVKNHIEFHLGGGGYGTFADLLSSPYAPPPIPQTETAEEARIKSEIATTTDASVRRSLERRLGELQRQRQADNAAAERQVAELNRAAQAEEQERRLASGSRFNIRFNRAVPPEALTPEGVMAALADYVDFSPMGGGVVEPEPAPGPGAGIVSLKKGMTVAEVEQLLGPAKSVDTDEAGGLEITIRTYEHPDHQVVAKFASGVLVDFAITPH
jgi:hypothetical protein